LIAELGIVTTGLAFVAAMYALVLSLAGAATRRDSWVVSARNAALITFPLLTAANLLLIWALLSHDFSIAYVWQTSSVDTPTFYLITGLWGSQAGSLLFWSWLMSAFVFATLLLNWKSERRLMPYVIAVTMATLGFFLILNVFIENPFARYWITADGGVKEAVIKPTGTVVADPTDGQGLNALLRHFGMVFHPPMLYLGFVGFVIPFAFAMAALATGQLGSGWLRATRTWALVAWLFLSMGLLLGALWAYDVLGWGGYWFWDPVENSALLPWLTGTAFLHSVVVQEKRGMLKFWNMLLIILTFILVILGTFATRSGVISSVHSFAESPIGPPMFSFLAGAMLVSLGLLFWRQGRGDLRGADELDALISKESFFLLNNWLFLWITVVVAWGTWAEAITTIMVDLGLRDTIINYGSEYYQSLRGVPIPLMGVYILMGIAPLAAWRRAMAGRLGRAILIPALLASGIVALIVVFSTDNVGALIGYWLMAFVGLATITEIAKGVRARARRGENVVEAFTRLIGRDRRRYGGYFIHLGMVVIGIGVIGSTFFEQTHQETLQVGERMTLGDYTMQHNGLFQAQAEDGRTMLIAKVTVFNKNGDIVDHIRPRRDGYQSGETMSIPGNHRTLAGDFYVRIESTSGNTVTFRAYLKPLVNFIWTGGVILILGTLVGLWPERQPSRTAQRARIPEGMRGATAGD
jgi:cytochrome c-type biogenesis protein CcmF